MSALKEYLKGYSLDDLAKGFFALNLWLPNIASPIKSQYLYTLLEEIASELPNDNRLRSYDDFSKFATKIIELIPQFPMIEDYVPEQDWGEIKYFYNNHFYQIFYGGDLSNPYEFYNSFEIIHKWFNEYYLELVNRSPLTEFQFVLELQDLILKNLHQNGTDDLGISPGDFAIPDQYFWEAVTTFIDGFKPEEIFDRQLVEQYTHDGMSASTSLSEEEFSNRAFDGENCLYFFIQKDERFFPVLPRRYFSVFFDSWGKILKDNYSHILLLDEAQEKKPEQGIYVSLVKFLKNRFKKNDVLEFATPVSAEMKPHGTIFAAIKSKNKLFMVYVAEPSINKEILENHLNSIAPQLAACKKLLETPPTQLALITRKEGVRFDAADGNFLEPHFIVVVPHSTTQGIMSSVPEAFDEVIVLGLDQFLGLMDEMTDLSELSDFIDYVSEIKSSAHIPPITSYLDLYGSYKDSNSVLIPGANKPNMIMIDFGWGSNTRYRSLKTFWSDFPEDDFFGHPMSWLIPEDRKSKNGFILKSRNFFGYAYFQRIGDAVVYINAPVDRMNFEQGKVTDSLMHTLADSFNIYVEILGRLAFYQTKNKSHVIFFPASLVRAEEQLKHVSHLVQSGKLWEMDTSRLGPNDYGIRVVYNEEMLLKALEVTNDRSIQIQLLQDVLHQINSLRPVQGFNSVQAELELEKKKKPRFKTMKIEKHVAFPEGIQTPLPDTREFKLADKEIAEFAHKLGISPGTYSGKDAKERIDKLIVAIVAEIDNRVAKYNLEKSLPLILGTTDALIAGHERDEIMSKISLDQEVDYERAAWSSEKYLRFLGFYKSFRYLIEKFVQHQSTSAPVILERDFIELIALVDRLLDVRAVSDILHYGIYPSEVTIDDDFIVSIQYGADLGAIQNSFSEEQEKLKLGEIGIDTDAADVQIPIEDYLNELNYAFLSDFGFAYSDLINVQQILALWPEYSEQEENSYYSANLNSIALACVKGIKDFDRSKVAAIVNFLELKSQNILRIEGQVSLAKDLPTWEHNKRLTRYSIRPLIKIGELYYWGPHSVNRAAKVWANTTRNHRFPAEILAARKCSAVLLKGHRSIEESLVKKAKEIVQRYTQNMHTGVQPHKIDSGIGDNRYGDYDVLAYIEEKNVLLNIESKVIDPYYSLKDLQSTLRNTFYGRTRSDGAIEKSDLQRVEDRAAYLSKEYAKIMNHYRWPIPATRPRVVSIFLTKMGYWWMKALPVTTEVKFVQVKLLDDFLGKI